MDPLAIYDEVCDIVKTLYDIVKTMKANKNKCTTLVRRIESVTKTLRQYDFSQASRIEDLLKDYLACVKEAQQIILIYSDRNWFNRVINVYEDKGRFKGINDQLTDLVGDLNLGLALEKSDHQRIFYEDDEKDLIQLQAALQNLIDDGQNMGSIRYTINQIREEKIPSIGTLNKNLFLRIQASDVEMGDVLGHGGSGTVYKSIWRGTPVAVKKLKRLDKESMKRDFVTEINALSGLRHKNIVTFMCACSEMDNPMIVTELMEMNLHQALKVKAAEMKFDRKIKIALDIAQGMQFLLSASPRIHHRDLKSLNILVGTGWSIKICDFGLAKIKEQSKNRTFSKAGTPQWCAPEIVNPDYELEIDMEKSDVFSFGVVLWELATGLLPWDGWSLAEVISAAVDQRRLEIPEHTNSKMKELMEACWNQAPAERPNFRFICDSLKDILANHQMQSRIERVKQEERAERRVSR